jgi:hypothetical protein
MVVGASTLSSSILCRPASVKMVCRSDWQEVSVSPNRTQEAQHSSSNIQAVKLSSKPGAFVSSFTLDS